MSISSRRIHRTGDQRLLRERFEYNPGAWTEAASAADNRYDVIWTGSGIVQITPQKTLQLESTVNPSANGWGDTASSLVVGRNTVGDFDETVRMRTIAQLRNEAVPAGSRGSPNPWEVAWFGWHFVRSGIDNAFYYVALKPNGFELGKVDQRLRKQDGGFILNGGQRFMYTDAVPYRYMA